MRETLEALNSLGFSVGQPEMAPQSEPRDGFNNAQEKMSSSREESTLHSCSGHETPGQKEGIHTEQAEAPCMGSQACTPQKAEPAGSVPVLFPLLTWVSWLLHINWSQGHRGH
ncbi:zinc finger protein 467 isoform X2 [Grammomys surdaster]|uniref:zinc finger protein 467 isoform X2 n=1 Tax=Grammomys surdaster TaxID=491861 RepID=UPI0010A00782|nr:zinc finger protein 467 isoform X2 [Grammomys surdaster]